MEAVTKVRWPAWALGAVIALQVAVPTVALVFGDPPAMFSFPMYSGRGQVTVHVLDDQGNQLPYQQWSKVAGDRPEIDWTRYLPEHLCEVVPHAHTVTVTQQGREGRLTCE